MKILMLNYEYPPLGGGAANATWYLLDELSKLDNICVDLITSSDAGFHQESSYDNITVHYLDIGKKGNVHYQSNQELLKYAWKAYQYTRKLVLSGRNFDFAHAFFGIPSGYIAMKLGIPYIVSLRGSDVPFYNQRFALLDRLIFKKLSGKIWAKASRVVANSEGLKSLALRSHPQIPIAVIPNGVDTQAFIPPVQQKKNEIMTVVSTGRLIQRKGYDLLLRALSDVPDTRLVLAGDGPEKQNLLQLANQLSVELLCLGPVKHEEIPGVLHEADLFILPSRNEGMSNSVLEAMACGLPIISTDVGGNSELIDGNGFIIPCDDINALRDKILKYKDNPDQLVYHGNKSRQIAQKMSWGRVAEEYVEIYKNIQQ